MATSQGHGVGVGVALRQARFIAEAYCPGRTKMMQNAVRG